MKISKQKNLGFTLIELLVVVAIISVLSAVVLAGLTTAKTKSQNAVRLSDMDQIHKALELYATNGASFPSTGADAWFCVKKSNCVSPANIGVNSLPTLTAALTTSISKIPTDPKFTSGIGSDYTYSSNVDPDGVLTVFSRGAYLSWVSDTSAVCGRGTYYIPVTNGYECFLRIGNSS